jgi:hypothetical protein
VTDAEIQGWLTRAAHDGARAALKEIGLSDETAAADVRELRALLDAYRLAKRTVAQTTLRVVTIAVVGAVLAWVGLHSHWLPD